MTLKEIYEDLERLKGELSSHDIKVKKDLDLKENHFLKEAKESLNLACTNLFICLSYQK